MLVRLYGPPILEWKTKDFERIDVPLEPTLVVRISKSGSFCSQLSVGDYPQSIQDISVSGFINELENDIQESALLDHLSEANREEIMRRIRGAGGFSFIVGSDGEEITHRRGKAHLLRFDYAPISRLYSPIEKVFLECMNIFQSYLSDMVYVSVHRGFLQPDYPLDKEPPESLTGDKVAPDEILNIQAYEDYRDKEKTREMKEWAGKFGIKSLEIEIQPEMRVEGRSSIPVDQDEDTLPLCLYGFDSNQFLTVIGKCIFSTEGAPILIEEPEIHLHPEMQALATDFLIETMKKGHQLFVTTHSEHMITRIQRRIAEGRISPEDVGIFWSKMIRLRAPLLRR